MATLLIIDDDSSVRETLHDVFSPPHECHTADRAEQALEFLELETYDVVLTDISMPGMGGFAILKHITERHPDTPVIVISGQADVERDDMLALGAFEFFAKPFQLEEVEAAVQTAIAHREQLKSATASRLSEAY